MHDSPFRRTGNNVSRCSSHDTLFSEASGNVPGGKAIIRKRFRYVCFTGQGMRVESTAFGAVMHGLEAELMRRNPCELVDK